MFAFFSTFNTVTRYSGYSTLEAAMQSAKQWARANFTAADVEQDGQVIARIGSNGSIMWF